MFALQKANVEPEFHEEPEIDTKGEADRFDTGHRLNSRFVAKTGNYSRE